MRNEKAENRFLFFRKRALRGAVPFVLDKKTFRVWRAFIFSDIQEFHDLQRTAGHNNVPVDIEKLNAILANWINTPNEMHPPNLLSASEREITRRVACPETCFWCSPNEFFIVAAGGGRWAPSPGPRRLLLAGRFSTETFSAPISSAANGQALVLASSGARSASPVSLRPWWIRQKHTCI